jgi:hypothetical protein
MFTHKFFFFNKRFQWVIEKQHLNGIRNSSCYLLHKITNKYWHWFIGFIGSYYITNILLLILFYQDILLLIKKYLLLFLSTLYLLSIEHIETKYLIYSLESFQLVKHQGLNKNKNSQYQSNQIIPFSFCQRIKIYLWLRFWKNHDFHPSSFFFSNPILYDLRNVTHA